MLYRELLAVNKFFKKKHQTTTQQNLFQNNNGLDRSQNNDPNDHNKQIQSEEEDDESDAVSGGILADEMGLGMNILLVNKITSHYRFVRLIFENRFLS
jgi:SNF2 family DNA or RNA helicase